LSATTSFSQQSKLSFESSYFQLIDEDYTQDQYKSIVDVGLKLLFRENKTHNFGFSVNANFSNSPLENKRNFNTPTVSINFMFIPYRQLSIASLLWNNIKQIFQPVSSGF
tara:strand:+ start:371 stop:700 length:330 start_codon:yes stop_codon:yes gene_type:complete